MQGSLAFVIALDTQTNHLIGMGRVISDGTSDGYLQDVIVLPEFRKLGIGTENCEYATNSMQEKKTHMDRVDCTAWIGSFLCISWI